MTATANPETPIPENLVLQPTLEPTVICYGYPYHSTPFIVVPNQITMEEHNDGPILDELSEIERLLAKFADPLGQDQEPEDSYSAEEGIVGYLGRKRANHKVWLSGDVHLKVVSDLVIGWEQAGKSGKWPIHSIRWAAREQGQGNRPWYIGTLDLEDNNHRVWRLTKGGQSKREITIKEIGSYKRTYVMN